jgi:putative DNA primase/helicase
VYDPNIRSTEFFGKFVKDVLYAQEIRTAIESIAYTFLRDYPFEYIFKLFGYGSNGKTVFTGILSALHGANNISNVPLQEILTNHFALSDLENKDVNIDTELPGITIKETAVVKKLTSGRKQPLRIERKNQRAYDTYLHAKLFFSANKIPESLDQTDAYYRREVIISFPNKFEGKNADVQLLTKLTNPQELSAIFNICMIALRNVLKNSGIYINERTIDERRRKYERSVNPVKAFLEEALAEDAIESDWVIKETLYQAYKRFCKKYQLPVDSIESLGRNLKKEKFEDGRESKRERKTYWKGIKLKEEYRLESIQQTMMQTLNQ